MRNHGKTRRDQRGAALVEAVVVIPFFLTILAGVIFVGKMYTTKLEVMRLSKQRAQVSRDEVLLSLPAKCAVLRNVLRQQPRKSKL